MSTLCIIRIKSAIVICLRSNSITINKVMFISNKYVSKHLTCYIQCIGYVLCWGSSDSNIVVFRRFKGAKMGELVAKILELGGLKGLCDGWAFVGVKPWEGRFNRWTSCSKLRSDRSILVVGLSIKGISCAVSFFWIKVKLISWRFQKGVRFWRRWCWCCRHSMNIDWNIRLLSSRWGIILLDLLSKFLKKNAN